MRRLVGRHARRTNRRTAILTASAGNAVQVSASAGAFDPTTLFAGSIGGGFYDISDISTLFQDAAGTVPVAADGDPVRRVNDKSGNGNNLTCTNDAFRPLYKISGATKFLLLDGVDDWLSAAFVLGTTWHRVSAIQPLAFPGSNEVYYGPVSGSEQLFGSATGQLTMWNGSASGPVATGLVVGTDCVLTEKWENPCQIAVDNGSYVATPSVAATNPGGFTISDASQILPANFRFYGGVVINRALTAPEIAQQRTFWGAKQGRTL